MYTEWQGMSTVEIQRVDKAIRNADDKSQCKRRNNRRKLLLEPSILVAASVVFLTGMHEINRSQTIS
jgi:hypothetical protein